MKLILLGLDGATWDVLEPLLTLGVLPNLERLRREGSAGVLRSVFPPLSPVAWTSAMTGKNPGKHGVFEFLEHGHNPLHGRVNSSRSIHSELLWEIAGRHGKKTIVGGVPMSYPPRPAAGFPGFYLGDFLSPSNAEDFTTDPKIFSELEREVGPYRPWSTVVHDGGNESAVLEDLIAFADQHLKAVAFLMKRCDWDLLIFDVMATDRWGHELWHVWDLTHPRARNRATELERLRPRMLAFWKTLDEGIGAILDRLPADASLLILSDHGFGPIEKYVNLNTWLLEQGYLVLKDSFYVRQKHWFFKRGVTPEWVYGLMGRLGMAGHRVSRFRGKQQSVLDRLGESVFLSRRHVDWARTRVYAQGNFGQIYVNQRGRQPLGCVLPEEVEPLIDELADRLRKLVDPEVGAPLVEQVFRRHELYDGPQAHLGPDLTVVLGDWRYRTIGLHDFTTHRVVSPAFGPTGDHRMEGIFLAAGPAFRAHAAVAQANLLDIAPTALHVLGVQVPGDFDGRVLTELLNDSLGAVPETQTMETPGASRAAGLSPGAPGLAVPPIFPGYSEEEEQAIQKRLTDLGYL